MPRRKAVSRRTLMARRKVASRLRREHETDEERARRRALNAERQRRARELETEEQRAKRIALNTKRTRAARAKKREKLLRAREHREAFGSHVEALDQESEVADGSGQLIWCPWRQVPVEGEDSVMTEQGREDAIAEAVALGFYDAGNDCEPFRKLLKHHVQTLGYEPTDIYWLNATGLYWKALPEQVYFSIGQPDEDSFSKERLTVLMCANSTATHKVPIQVVGRWAWNTPSFRGMFSCDEDAVLRPDMFSKWYQRVFIPAVKERQRSDGRQGNVLLVVDPVPPGGLALHPPLHELNRVDGRFQVMCWTGPYSVVDHAGAAAVRTFYRRFLLQRLVVASSVDRALRISKHLTLAEACHMLENAWCSVPRSFLASGWKWLWCNDIEDNGNASATVHSFDGMLCSLRMVPGCTYCNYSDLHNWLDLDQFDRGHGWGTPAACREFVWDMLPIDVEIDVKEEPSDSLSEMAAKEYKNDPNGFLGTEGEVSDVKEEKVTVEVEIKVDEEDIDVVGLEEEVYDSTREDKNNKPLDCSKKRMGGDSIMPVDKKICRRGDVHKRLQRS